ncbi:Six-hairpin glycosidase-like protein [Mycena haematopus]|nr:Six-hairpin glycosidase-like protein [Mycena haematopus]
MVVGIAQVARTYWRPRRPENCPWFRDRYEVGTTKASRTAPVAATVQNGLTPQSRNIRMMSVLLTAAYLHEMKAANYFVHLDSWAEWLPRTDEGGFQHITYLLPAVIGLGLDLSHYIEEAKRQFTLHIKYLQDLRTGVWFHGTYTVERTPRTDLDLAQDGPLTGFIELLKIDALVKCQDEATGLWHTILDDPTSHLKASATAGFAYGIMKSLRLRLIPREEKYIKAPQKAIQGVMDNITPEGELLQVSCGTPVFKNIEEYKKIKLTSMPYGQSLAMFASTEHLRTSV